MGRGREAVTARLCLCCDVENIKRTHQDCCEDSVRRVGLKVDAFINAVSLISFCEDLIFGMTFWGYQEYSLRILLRHAVESLHSTRR